MNVSTLLLGLGYAAAVPTFPFVGRIAWRRNRAAFATLELGTMAIVAGWALRGERVPAWLNAGFGVGFMATWVVVGRIRRQRESVARDA